MNWNVSHIAYISGQKLWETDKEIIDQFAQLVKQKLQENPDFLNYIWSSDEFILILHGAKNKQNCMIWSSNRLETIYESPQSSPTLIV